MKDIAVSVVIPVYNVKKYLRECLDSVIGQTLENIEIICVDDGSTDGSSELLDEYAKKDKRIKVIHKANGGYGHTMNTGNLMAQGEYLAIAEPDDYISENMYEDLYRLVKEYDLDFVKSKYYCFWGDGAERSFEVTHITTDGSLYNKVLDNSDIKKLIRGTIGHWSGLYKREFIEKYNIRYNETPGASYQDAGYHFQTMIFAGRGYITDKAYYRYRQDNPNSSVANKSKVFCICEEHNFIYNILKRDKAVFEKYADCFELFKYENYMFNLRRISDEYKVQFVTRIKEEYERSISLNEMNKEMLWDSEIADIEAMIESPENYVCKFKEVKERLYDKLKGYETVIIYGAGGKGAEILEILRGYLHTFGNLWFAVSDKKYINKTKCGYPIKCIYDLAELKDEAVVVIGVTELYKKEIEKVLIDLKFKNIVSLD